MAFAKRVYQIAGIYGLVVLVPQYFLEAKNGRDFPPAITHPEYYYGFIGVAVAWQLAFLLIATDPIRFRPLMIAAIVEKASFGLAALVLFALGRIHALVLVPSGLDLVLGVLFVAAYVKTPPARISARDV
jgi:hypothetical protein